MREFASGIGLFFRGVGFWARRPKLMAIGAVPALITTVLYGVALVWLFSSVDEFAVGLTPFAESWVEPWQTIVRVAVAGALLVAGFAATVFTFAAVTLTIAAPFIDNIQERVDRELGGVDPIDEGFWLSVRRGIGDGLRLFGMGLFAALIVFVCGLLPLVGSLIGWLLGAYFAGRAFAVDLTGTPGDARGIPLTARRQLLASNRAKSLGFGVAVYLSFLIPLGAVVGTPAAAVGGTLLLRELHGEPTEPRR
ncbi:EI24 domain-containing protein [Gulosibacter sp. ACHW.36C]|uniref:EI24 domain-containing protein n=1 Tax=Gulosibacter sediminis TaxID=1729695 RepID=A0ABY4MVE4_9MICO|nr:EI24 domain-containing protein [Gulosibacter sediminis]UQN13769.1 EI24 domain-containing protein [Gulosibacter sediminis]